MNTNSSIPNARHSLSTRFAALFGRLSAADEVAFVPFLNLCDPDAETSEALLLWLAESGADAFELGIPFSDPTADGPVLEESAHRALDAGATRAKCFDIIRRVRERHPELPISLMVYINLVAAAGLENFFERAQVAGVDAVLIPDLPISMRLAEPEWDRAARGAGIHLAAIASPNAGDDVLHAVAERSRAYVYLLSRAGITGVDQAAGHASPDAVEVLKAAHAAPMLLGFGVSRPEHVEEARRVGAAGVIVGSAFGRIIAEHLDNREAMLERAADYARTMKAACRTQAASN